MSRHNIHSSIHLFLFVWVFLPELVMGNNSSFLLFESVADLRKREVNVIDILTVLL